MTVGLFNYIKICPQKHSVMNKVGHLSTKCGTSDMSMHGKRQYSFFSKDFSIHALQFTFETFLYSTYNCFFDLCPFKRVLFHSVPSFFLLKCGVINYTGWVKQEVEKNYHKMINFLGLLKLQ
ncbi:hypothetical protein Mapa_002857 [Marchantia paleacea]|nr:hypothetical protein Mapa_002857 [Marchantia paleacea]